MYNSAYASLTYEDPAHLQITYRYLYYLKYTDLKSLFGNTNQYTDC